MSANTTNTLILSSAGLKNIVSSNKVYGEDFTFIFGKEKFTMSNVLAEFLSPKVSKLHKTDPTIDHISYDKLENISNIEDEQEFDNIFVKDILSLITKLTKGEHIELKDEYIPKLQLISILLENEELFQKLNEFSSTNNIDDCIHRLELFEYFQEISKTSAFDYSTLIDQISSQFYSIDQTKLKHLPRSTLLRIISSDKLKLESEDSLYDFIESIFEDKSDMTIYDFYESIELNALSESKFREFVSKFDYNELSSCQWTNFQSCFYMNNREFKLRDNRYSQTIPKTKGSEVKYSGDGFNGIIRSLTINMNGNVDDKNCVRITSSSVLGSGYPAKFAADLDSSDFFHSASESTSWLKYDFKERKVCPTHYSIRTHNDYNSSPRSWVVEGSNTGSDGDWQALDTQTDNSIFQPNKPVSHTFEIKQSNAKHVFYQYLRIRSTGPNNNNCDYFAIEALEFFGFVLPSI